MNDLVSTEQLVIVILAVMESFLSQMMTMMDDVVVVDAVVEAFVHESSVLLIQIHSVVL